MMMNGLLYLCVVGIWGTTWFAIALQQGEVPLLVSIFWRFALAGGLLGNQIGGGNGKKLATVAGAVGGGYAGNKVQEGMQNRDTYTTTQTRCNTVNDLSEKVVGYDVKYSIGDKAGQVRMERDPGSQIPLDENGKLVLTQAQPGQ